MLFSALIPLAVLALLPYSSATEDESKNDQALSSSDAPNCNNFGYIRDAAISGNLPTMQLCATYDAPWLDTPLLIAQIFELLGQNSQVGILGWFKDSNLNIGFRDSFIKAMEAAVRFSRLSVCQFLLGEADFSSHKRKSLIRAALKAAVLHNQNKVLSRIFFETTMDPELWTSTLKDAFLLALKYQKTGALKFLLVFFRTYMDETMHEDVFEAALQATKTGSVEFFKLLMEESGIPLPRFTARICKNALINLIRRRDYGFLDMLFSKISLDLLIENVFLIITDMTYQNCQDAIDYLLKRRGIQPETLTLYVDAALHRAVQDASFSVFPCLAKHSSFNDNDLYEMSASLIVNWSNSWRTKARLAAELIEKTGHDLDKFMSRNHPSLSSPSQLHPRGMQTLLIQYCYQKINDTSLADQLLQDLVQAGHYRLIYKLITWTIEDDDLWLEVAQTGLRSDSRENSLWMFVRHFPWRLYESHQDALFLMLSLMKALTSEEQYLNMIYQNIEQLKNVPGFIPVLVRSLESSHMAQGSVHPLCIMLASDQFNLRHS